MRAISAPRAGRLRAPVQLSLEPVRRLIEALADPKRRERVALFVLAAYVALWTLYGVIAKSSQDMQQDAAELVSWSHHLVFGFSKHPPLAAWIVHGWFELFPISDWSYYLLSMSYAALGLWIAWRLFGYFLDPGKRIAALACLTLVPYFNFHGLRFDHNAVLGALWAATALCFIRSYETRSAIWAALAGAAAAGAMLGKYWSIFLIAGLALAALIDSRRGVYFRSAAPWITVAVGGLLLAPHIAWLVNHDFISFSYATGTHETATFGQSVVKVAGFLAGGAGYAAVPVLMVVALSRPPAAAFKDILLPHDPNRRFVAVTFWTLLLLPAAVALIFGFELNSLWTMSAFVLLPVVLLSSPLLVLSRQAITAIVAFAIAVPAVVLAASPGIAFALHVFRVSPSEASGKLLAERVQDEWQNTTASPLRIVAGDYDTANVVAFYLPEQPAALPLAEPATAPWVTPERMAREGVALTCSMGKVGHDCEGLPMQAIDKIVANNPEGSRRSEVTIERSYFGEPGKPGRFLIVIVPPRT
jgi:Dolichyl-phosphate-mannose-protein mannosyltransferase